MASKARGSMPTAAWKRPIPRPSKNNKERTVIVKVELLYTSYVNFAPTLVHVTANVSCACANSFGHTELKAVVIVSSWAHNSQHL